VRNAINKQLAYPAKGGDTGVGGYRDFVTPLCIEMANKL
jgi:hypothetical protein